jgi:hypothetical protein
MHTKAEAIEVNEFARNVFLHDGCHIPLIILYKGEHNCLLPVQELIKSDMGKEALSIMIRRFIKEDGISGVVFISEAWMSCTEDEKEIQKLKTGKKRVRDLKTKQEILLVTAESDDGLNISFVNPIERDIEGNPTLKETIEQNGSAGGRFSGFFAE